MAGVWNLLLSTLEDMLAEELKTFIFFLNDLPEGVQRIRQGRLENKAREEIVRLLVQTYHEEGAVKVTLHTLRKAKLNDPAKKLEEKYNSLFPDVEDRCDWIKRLQDVSQAAAGASGSDDITVRKGGAVCSRPDVTPGAERDPANHPESRAETELGGAQSDDPFLKLIEESKQILKSDLKTKLAKISDGLGEESHLVLLNDIYTELYVTEGGKRQASRETEMICNNIFKLSPDEKNNTITTVLTKGIAGIGKTVSVHKFILDWAEGKANQDIDFIFTLPFRDLNLNKEEFSLMELLQHYFPRLALQNIFSQDKIQIFDRIVKVLFIFDGFDECRLDLDFQNKKMWFDVTKKTSVENLLTNLILKILLPSALLWITSRPAAASKIPHIERVTELRGFNDSQKEEYFRKRFSDQTDSDLADRVITHIKSSGSLYIICHIPIICWILAAVLGAMFDGDVTKAIPKTLTEIYTHFLLIQTSVKKEKYHGTKEKNPKNMTASDVDSILKLGHLAFQQLEKGNLIFYEKDLKECEIDVTEAVNSGVFSCKQIFKEEAGLYGKTVYSFVHLSIQEYLAALFVFHSFVKENKNILRADCMEDQEEDEEDAEEEHPLGNQSMPLFGLYRLAVDIALRSENGHLDLFLRFLLGLSLESTQELIQDLLTQTGSSAILADRLRNPNDIRKKRGYVREKNPSPTFMEKLKTFFGIKSTPRKSDSPRKPEGASHLRKIESSSQNTDETVQYIKEKIRGEYSAERIMNLFHCLNELNESSLINEMQTSLQSGTLSEVTLEPGQCSALVYVLLMSEKVDLFDLQMYKTSVAGRLRMLTMVKNCRRALLTSCSLPEESCEILASALQSDSSPLVEVDLSNNDLGDSGVKLLCAGLENPNCRLQTLRLSGCQVTKEGCASLASALRSNPSSHLGVLDLSYNHPGESGKRALSAWWKHPGCRLNVDHGGEIMLKPGLRKYACQLTLDPNTAHKELSLSEGNRRVTRSPEKQEPCPDDHPDRFDCYHQVLCREGLTGRCYWEVEWPERDNGMSQGWTAVGVAYKGICRKGLVPDSSIGGSEKSWSLEFNKLRHFSQQNGKYSPTVESDFVTRRVGVYLDSPAGILSFYRISSDTLTHLYTFHTTFSEPVYPGFGVCRGTSVSLCMLG